MRNKNNEFINNFSNIKVLTGISTLTIINNEEAPPLFLMHKRNIDSVSYAMNNYHVIPAEEFQPSSKAAASFKEDLDFWKNIMREYSEEIGCNPEFDGNSGKHYDYEREPLKTLNREKQKDNIKLYFLGFGLDPLTLQGEILTTCVFKNNTFNKIFSDIHDKNKEGDIISDYHRWGRPFNKENIELYLNEQTLAAGETILKLAWKHKDILLQ